ncbi:helix-turn-helix domain-containing protein [Barnesiella intestinihominis]|uniref:helix-turn-helix domain-containing protein n=1 Tax=Barnesiella intestinihominis TaxID=487174 RepID=UPI0026727AF2|nr:helix-turn-helix domain-containing protein [Barnesiella intestinihominis]
MSKGKFNDVKDDIISYIREGDSNILACKKVGISKETFYTWINDKPDFSDSLKKARKEFRETIVQTLEQSLWKRAAGYEVEEVKNEYRTLKDGSKVLVKSSKITKHFPPDTGALIFALTNLDPENWKNRQDNRLSVDDGISGFKISVVHKEGTPPIANSEDDIAD